MGRYDEAKEVLENGLRKFPESYALWTGLGILCDILGLYFEALKCFDIALRFNYGQNSGSLYNKALILTKLGSYGDAMSIIDDLVERYPEDARYLAERGYLSLEMGYAHEALRYFQRVMELFEKFPSVCAGVSVYSGLCCACMELGMKKEAMQIALEGLAKFPDEDPVLYHNVGATFLEMGWTEDARRVLQKGVEKFPNDEELKKFLKDIEEDLDPQGGELLGLFLILVAASVHKKFKKK
jgi:tetratricopeptide (TPR) repeat protein